MYTDEYTVGSAPRCRVLDETLHRALEVFSSGQMPSLIFGGVAVRLWGSERIPNDIDFIVANDVRAKLLLFRAGFISRKDRHMLQKMVDPGTGIEVDTVTGGTMQGASRIPVPICWNGPTFVTLIQLFENKLGLLADPSFGYRHEKDRSDLVELAIIHELDFSFPVGAPVREEYETLLQTARPAICS